MALTDEQIAKLSLGALRRSGISVSPDDLEEMELYVEEGFDYLEEHHVYDPKQYAVTSGTTAVQYYALWRFCSIRPDMANLSSHYKNEYMLAERSWSGEAATQANIDHSEYPENRTRVTWNNDDPLNQSRGGLFDSRYRLGT